MAYTTGTQPDTVIDVRRAGALNDQHVPVLRINATSEMPELSTLPSGHATREIFIADGRAIADALHQHLPGGTFSQVLIRLLEITATSLHVPLEAGLR